MASYSGKFNVRITSQQHARLASTAHKRGVSLNTAVSEAIDQWVSPPQDGSDPDEVLVQFRAAAEIVERHLRRR